MKLWSVKQLKRFGRITLSGAYNEALERKASETVWQDYVPEGGW